jgi:hypothetical protein
VTLPMLALLFAQVTVPTVEVGEGGFAIQQVYVSVCGTAVGGMSSSGVSGNVVSGESRICEILRVAAALDSIGEHESARALVLSARDLVDPDATYPQRAAFWTRQHILDPLFDLLPWIGTSAY